MPKQGLLLKLLIAQKKTQTQQGLSLAETLMTIVIVMIILALSTPPLLIAMANRVQTRRTEQAIQIAQQEIERIRVLVEEGDYANTALPPAYTMTSPNWISNVPAPNAICASTPCPTTRTYDQLERQGDFLVQTFRDQGITLSGGTTQVVVFRMGVRVYSSLAQRSLGSLETQLASIQMLEGEGQQRRRPLAVLYSDFTRGDLVGSLQKQRDFSRRLRP